VEDLEEVDELDAISEVLVEVLDPHAALLEMHVDPTLEGLLREPRRWRR